MYRQLDIQAAALLAALTLGVAAGLGYDVFRILRRRAGRAVETLLDALYCALVGTALFAFAMAAPEGRLGVWELALMLTGFLLYMRSLSRLILRPLTALAASVEAFGARTRAKLKKYSDKMIFLFQKARECFIMRVSGTGGKAEDGDA